MAHAIPKITAMNIVETVIGRGPKLMLIVPNNRIRVGLDRKRRYVQIPSASFAEPRGIVASDSQSRPEGRVANRVPPDRPGPVNGSSAPLELTRDPHQSEQRLTWHRLTAP
jgi:hypothetical protein